MDTGAKKNWAQKSWTIPLSVALHVLIGATYLFWPGHTPAPAEPESVSVEMVEPPKEEPPKEEPPKPEEKKAEEPPPPPPAKEKPQEQPPPPPPSQMSSVPMRPEPTQLDERDEPGQQDAAGQEQPKPEPVEEAVTPQPATQPSPEPAEAEAKPEPSAAADATAEQGEIPAAEAPVPEQDVAAVVPTPKPEIKPAAEQPAQVVPDGEGDPKLKPAKKILAASKRPGPMMRQIFGNLSPRDRVMQLCFAEVVAQIKEAPQGGAPDGLQFLKRDLAGNVMDAKAAFNIGPQWFPIDYRCEVDIDKYVVTEFRYNIHPKLSPDEIRRLELRAN